MRFFETNKGNVIDENYINEAIYIISGTNISTDDIDPTVLGGIKREVEPDEWKTFADRGIGYKICAVKLYRGLKNCSLMEAKEGVEKYLENK